MGMRTSRWRRLHIQSPSSRPAAPHDVLWGWTTKGGDGWHKTSSSTEIDAHIDRFASPCSGTTPFVFLIQAMFLSVRHDDCFSNRSNQACTHNIKKKDVNIQYGNTPPLWYLCFMFGPIDDAAQECTHLDK